ncbi:transcriptional regulator, TetR family [Frankineae bacterium MT45]|nr:transcriptional regulator, TetR family [Frankineae bacterium MT45]
MLAIMERTTLSRKSFYVYFRDRSEVITALVRPLRIDADAAILEWSRSTDPRAAGRAALASAARTYREHNAVLRAVFWAGNDDPDLVAVRSQLTQPVIDAGARAIELLGPKQLKARATELAQVLVTMNVHTLLGISATATDAELDRVVDTLSTAWERVIGLD